MNTTKYWIFNSHLESESKMIFNVPIFGWCHVHGSITVCKKNRWQLSHWIIRNNKSDAFDKAMFIVDSTDILTEVYNDITVVLTFRCKLKFQINQYYFWISVFYSVHSYNGIQRFYIINNIYYEHFGQYSDTYRTTDTINIRCLNSYE